MQDRMFFRIKDPVGLTIDVQSLDRTPKVGDVLDTQQGYREVTQVSEWIEDPEGTTEPYKEIITKATIRRPSKIGRDFW